MSHLDWNKLDPKLRERIIQSDPEGFNAAGIRPDAREMGAKIAQPQAQPALERKPQGRESGVQGVERSGPFYRVSIHSLRRRALDGDNLAGGCKPLRDSIARWLGVDDNERFIHWEYSQAETRGEQETLVRIEIL